MPEDPWFIREVYLHEAMLRSWLKKTFPDLRDVDDVIQDAYVKVCRLRESRPIHAPKALLFTTARNLALDRLRRAGKFTQTALVETDPSFVSEEGGDAVRQQIARDQELSMLTEAIQSLPTRCRQIFTLRKVYGLSQQAIADELGISVNTVSAQLVLGLKKCRAYLATHYPSDYP
ncbi:MAG: RNA polymerase sigma factor [Opitutales bacterium]